MTIVHCLQLGCKILDTCNPDLICIAIEVTVHGNCGLIACLMHQAPHKAFVACLGALQCTRESYVACTWLVQSNLGGLGSKAVISTMRIARLSDTPPADAC